jgi:hypothetical protein
VVADSAVVIGSFEVVDLVVEVDLTAQDNIITENVSNKLLSSSFLKLIIFMNNSLTSFISFKKELIS